MARWGSPLHHLSENTTTSPGSCILQQKGEYGHRNEWGYDWGGLPESLKVAGVGISALEVCPPLPSEKGSTRKIDPKVVVRPETPARRFLRFPHPGDGLLI